VVWFKVDDSFYDHPKVFDAPDCAVALWIRAGCWSARNLTDGFVPSSLPARLCGDPDTAVRDLLRRGLWLRVSGGYQFHDWVDYQPTADQVEGLRRKRAEAGRRGGLARAAKQKPSKSQAIASGVAKQNPTPTRPPPSSKEDGGGARAGAGRGAAPGTAKALAIAACQLCDHRGYVNGVICDHDPTTPQRAKRGAAAVRAALRRPA
jgi:hypothetical protein